MGLPDYVERLAALETFDRGAFIGDERVPQVVCDFVLSLAVAFNDLRDIPMLISMLKRQDYPESGGEPSRKRGLYGGLTISGIRLHMGATHELLRLVEKGRKEIDHPAFQIVVQRLSGPARESWRIVTDVAFARVSQDPVARKLKLLRNKVAFHYDKKIIGRGYREKFPDDASEPPFVSRGNSQLETRFFFADAATERYVLELGTEEGSTILYEDVGKLLERINLCLFELVTKFVVSRGCGWRRYQPHT